MTYWRAGPRRIVVAVALLVSIAAIVVLASDTDADHGHSDRRQLDLPSSVSVSTSTSQTPTRRVLTLGRSVQGRPITATVLGDPNAPRPVLVIGCIHGNETAGIAVADSLARVGKPPRSTLWIVRDLNPDGVHAGTRQNAHHVDLNRNFPFAWRPIGSPGAQQYSGPRALSEPESRIARSLILRIQPRITIWFHQPLGITDQSGGNIHIERRFATLSGLPLRLLTRYPGSATGWQNHRLPGTTAFVVELPPGAQTPTQIRRYRNAVLALANSTQPLICGQAAGGGGPWRTMPNSHSTAAIRSAVTRGPSEGGGNHGHCAGSARALANCSIPAGVLSVSMRAVSDSTRKVCGVPPGA